jgi:inner membrane protease subunit SOM1
MPPLVEVFGSSELAQRVNHLPNGKARKPPVENLKKCELREMFQYNCDLDGPKEDPASKIVCSPVLRLFRK